MRFRRILCLCMIVSASTITSAAPAQNPEALWERYEQVANRFAELNSQTQTEELDPFATRGNRIYRETIDSGQEVISVLLALMALESGITDEDREAALDSLLTTRQLVGVLMVEVEQCREGLAELNSLLEHPGLSVRPILLRGTRRWKARAEACLERQVADEATLPAELEVEELRLANEAAARQAEAEAEEQRLANEAAAQHAEEQRLANEAAAQQAEEQRLANEAAAQQAEQQRLTNEAAARHAEEQRLANEAAAQHAEEQRLANEAAAQQAEEQRLANEAAAQQAEQQRLTNEAAAQRAEEQRLANEAAAQQAETSAALQRAERERSSSAPSIVLLTVGVLAIGGAVGWDLATASQRSEWTELENSSSCFGDGTCLESTQGRFSELRRSISRARVGTGVLAGVGVASGITGIVLLLTRSKSGDSSVVALPDIGSNYAGIRLIREF